MRKIISKVDKYHFFYLFVIFSLFGIFVVLALLNVTVKKQIGEINIIESPISFVPSSYPQVVNKAYPDISAQGAIVMDSVSKVPLFEKNAHYTFPPASTTKIMTALVALDYYKPSDVIVIKQPNVEGSMLGFYQDEKFNFNDLLYAMLLPSSNEAAVAIAQNYPGGEAAFVEKMNKKAEQMGLVNTHFADPVGIEDQADYTSPFDLAILSSQALLNPTFSKIVDTKDIPIQDLDGKKYDFSNLNILLSIPGVNGIKTGHTEGAGDVLVTSRKIAGGDLIFVVMQSQDRFLDTETLVDYLNSNVNYLTIRP